MAAFATSAPVFTKNEAGFVQNENAISNRSVPIKTTGFAVEQPFHKK